MQRGRDTTVAKGRGGRHPGEVKLRVEQASGTEVIREAAEAVPGGGRQYLWRT